MKTLSVLCVCTLVVLSGSMTAEQKLKNCNDVRAAYSSKGFNVNDVPNKGVNGEDFYNIHVLFLFCFSAFMSVYNFIYCNASPRTVVSKAGAGDPPSVRKQSPRWSFRLMRTFLFFSSFKASNVSIMWARGKGQGKSIHCRIAIVVNSNAEETVQSHTFLGYFF